ncbi:MAG: NADH-quinone oxidoreductase subunit NuoI [Nitrospirota bacterium]
MDKSDSNRKNSVIKKIIDDTLFTEIREGLTLTFKHLFTKKVTFQYPREKRVLPPGYRGVMSMLRYEDGSERCVGCCLCEAYCPSKCIKVVPGEDENLSLKRYAREYYLDLTRCVFCGFCTEACPVNALAMTPEYEVSTRDKSDLYLNKEKLLEMGDKYYKETASFLNAHGMEALNKVVKSYPFTVLEKDQGIKNNK